MTEEIKPCPFCGHKYNPESGDTLYPSGIVRRADPAIGGSYYSWKDRKPGDQDCYRFHCPAHEGGCGAEMPGDSRQEAIDLWNRRVQLASPIL